MKQAYLVGVLTLVMASLTQSSAGSAESALMGQNESGKRKEEKRQGESAGKASGALGTKTNPVRCDGPKGERQYSSGLRCADGKRPVYSRIGSFGVGLYGNILDGYSVKCEGSDGATVFIDMYHKGHVEKEAVPGFTIVDSQLLGAGPCEPRQCRAWIG